MGGSKTGEESSSSGDSAAEEVGNEGENRISEYEKQRLARIEENRARLRALGLPHIASSFLSTPFKKKIANNRKKRKRMNDGDEEYRPSDEEEGGEEEDAGEKPSAGKKEEEEGEGTSSQRRRKGRNKCSSQAEKVRKKPFGKERMNESDDIDHNAALQQAIALSLGDAIEYIGSGDISHNCGTNGAGSSSSVKKERMNTLETAGRSARKVNKSRPELTEDEVVAHFFSFDVAGKGYITIQDLHRMVISHDFNWTDLEMKDMIHCFDGDRDGMLSMEEFRSILSHLNMLQGTGKC